MNQMRLIAVLRLSSKAQIQGHGKERQEEDEIRAYVDELGALLVDTWFVAERATIFERPQFESLLAKGIAMRGQGIIDGLILGSVDRLSRDPFDGGAVCRDALKAGLRLFFAEDRLDAFREEDQVSIIGHLVASRKYAQRLKAQTMPARRAWAKDGKIPNGRIRWPFDYDAANGTATPNRERARWVKRWYGDLRNGGSLGSIKKLMEQAGVPAPKGGKQWSRSTITRILADPALKGEFYCGFEKMETNDYWQPSRRVSSQPELIYSDKESAILTDDEWDSVQTMLGRNKEYSRRNTRYDYSPLHRLVKCQCGRKMGSYTHRRSGHGYIRCSLCRNGDINTVRLWESVRDWLLTCIQSSNMFTELVVNSIGAPETTDQVRQQIEANLAEIEEIDEAISRAIRMGVRLDRYEDRVESIIQELENRQTSVKADVARRGMILHELMEKDAGVRILESSIEDFRKLLPDVTDSEWRQFLLDLGLGAEIRHDDNVDVRISVRFSEVIKRLNAQKSLRQSGQILGGVVSLRS